MKTTLHTNNITLNLTDIVTWVNITTLRLSRGTEAILEILDAESVVIIVETPDNVFIKRIVDLNFNIDYLQIKVEETILI